MSQKKRKKRKAQGQKVTENPMELQQTEKTKQFKPLARNLLWCDLIFLAVCQLMYSNKLISEQVSLAATVIGAILLAVALYIQFGPTDRTPKAPRL